MRLRSELEAAGSAREQVVRDQATGAIAAAVAAAEAAAATALTSALARASSEREAAMGALRCGLLSVDSENVASAPRASCSAQMLVSPMLLLVSSHSESVWCRSYLRIEKDEECAGALRAQTQSHEQAITALSAQAKSEVDAARAAADEKIATIEAKFTALESK